MKAWLQRVSEADVTVDGERIGAIGCGYLVLLGVAPTDTVREADEIVKRIVALRIFRDEHDKINRSIEDVGGAALVVSQFTLYADTAHGRRPGFSGAARPELAEPLYEHVVAQLRARLGDARVATGRFGADMCVKLQNEGPFSVELRVEAPVPVSVAAPVAAPVAASARAASGRIGFIDTLRVAAIFMVMLIHCCEPFYLDADGFRIASHGDALALTAIDAAARAAVPLFVMASAYLLFPVVRPTWAFLKRRILRVGVPFLLWAVAYNAWNGGRWGEMFFNFPAATGGHLWFVPMLIGLYLAMPLLSPWAEKVGVRELRGILAIWLFTTLFPFLRHLWGWLYGAPSFGVTPFLYGECPWNAFGTFHYVSGFVGYMLLGFWFRRFAPAWSWSQALARALPLLAVGWAIVWSGFYFRIPDAAGYPVVAPYAEAVNLEMSWEFCSTGVAFMTAGYFILLRKLDFSRMRLPFVRTLAEASFGVYLMHIFILVPVVAFLRAHVSTSLAIVLGACAVFTLSFILSALGRRIPRIGPWIFG